ncbi:MAG: hypothetical protein RIE32_04950 [Phycisphaerales bacterium]
MGEFADKLTADIRDLFGEWSIRDGRKVPEQDDLGYGNVGSKIDATMLYADLADSTGLARDNQARIAAAISKAFLLSAVRIIRNNQGEIASFDGDRVMAIFYGDSQCSNAAIAALQINFAVEKIVQPVLLAMRPGVTYEPKHCVGIDRSEVTAVRAGIRGNNDLIWIGRAANYAAILSEIRSDCSTFITRDVYTRLNSKAKLKDGKGEDKWTKTSLSFKGQSVECYKSAYRTPV